MINMYELKVICCAACLIDLNEYLTAFTEENSSDKVDERALNETLLTVCKMDGVNRCICKVLIAKLLFKKSVDVFERI